MFVVNGVFSGVIRLHGRPVPVEIELLRTCFSADIQLPRRDRDICLILSNKMNENTFSDWFCQSMIEIVYLTSCSFRVPSERWHTNRLSPE